MSLPLSLARMRQFSPLMLVLLSAAAAVAAYLQALNYPFVSDDTSYLPENTKLLALPLAELWRLFIEPYNCCFELLPLRDLSYWFDIALFGLNPSASRLHNIFLYLLCLPLVYGTTLGIWRYFRPVDAASSSWAAAIITSLFALHPALVESVVWISGRKYVLPNLFSMLALWLAVRTRREQGLSALLATATLVAFVAVMLSKSSYVAVAPVIAMLWLIFWRDIPAPNRRYSQLLWPLAILFLAVFLTRVFIASNKGYDEIPFYFGVEVITRTLAVLGGLARLALSPENRHFFYPVFEDTHLPAMVALGVAVLAAAATGAVMMLRRRSLEGFALVAFLLLCMPYMQLIPYAPPSLIADRSLSLAVWPVILLVVALSWRLNPVPRSALLLVIALPWGFQTIERPRDWRSDEALIDTDLRAYPGYYMPAMLKIVNIQLPKGLHREAMETANNIIFPEIRDLLIKIIQADYAVHVSATVTGKPQEAVNLLQNLWTRLKQRPVQAKWNTPVNVLFDKKQGVLAVEWEYLAKQFPDDVSVRYNAGLWMLSVPRYEDAVAHLRVATESQLLPESVRGAAFYNLGLALLGSGHATEAEVHLHAALKQWVPDLRAYCLLSEVYKQTRRFEEAARAEASCLGRAPNEKSAQ